MRIRGLDHVQLAMPAGGEDLARAFYRGVLAMEEVSKPESLRASGGVWFRSGGRARAPRRGSRLPARPQGAHPGFEVESLDRALSRCHAAGVRVVDAKPIEGIRRVSVADPFGNRIELMERVGWTHGGEAAR